MEVFNIIFVILLIAITGFFVASEFAVIRVRGSRIDQLVQEGRKGSLAAKKVKSNLDEYLSACQLGITLTALGLGWLGEPTIHHLLKPVFENLDFSAGVANTISFIIAFSSITFLHVVIGELAPKTLAIQKAEAVTLLFSSPLIWFYKISYPIIWVLNNSARFITKLFGLGVVSEHEEAHSEEELRIILSESYKRGEINSAEYKYVNNIFEFDNRIAKEIMIPRVEMVGIFVEDSLEEIKEIIQIEKYTRYPVYHDDKDTILGMINVKDLYLKKESTSTIKDNIRPVLHIIETIPIYDLMLKMQKTHIPLAILHDEYGGTSGMVTLEDILEEIVGEIKDEYDSDEKSAVENISENHKVVDGKVLISELNNLLDIDIPESDVDTIGGWILTQNLEIEEGQSLFIGKYELKVIKKKANQILFIEIKLKSNE
ncbi:MAG: transporter associated domain protein [Bacillales bacterium]|jgi:CBS domain containing-hemolysin-like protein|nr:transporter associated domain protein [Bacillales bacterium]